MLKNFPHKWLAFRQNNPWVHYAFQYPSIGSRSDGIGNEEYMTNWECGNKSNTYLVNKELIDNLWRRAPLITERWGNLNTLDYFPTHVERYHIAMLANNVNFEGKNGDRMDPATKKLKYESDRKLMLDAGKKTGYRFTLDSVAVPRRAAGRFPIKSIWQNHGVTPAYTAWVVAWQLRGADGKVAAEWYSPLNLHKLLPTEGKPLTQEDYCVLPTTLAPGTYALTLQIYDGSGERSPLRLAVKTPPLPDGAYPICSMEVSSETSFFEAKLWTH